MSQNGPHPGPPWPGGGSGSDEPYTEPADPWGESGASSAPDSGWGAHPTSMAPAGDSSLDYSNQYAPPSWAAPAPQPPPTRRNTPIVALVVVLGLLICGGLGTTGYLLFGPDRTTPVVPETRRSTPAAVTSEPDPLGSAAARYVTVGQCVRNAGTTAKPYMRIVTCAGGTFKVLKRVEGRTTGEGDAESKCSGVTGYTKWYYFDSDQDEFDFVLCLRDV